jgi:hypothetical protein
MPLIYLLLTLEGTLILAVPPHFGLVFVRQYWLYYPNGGSWFAITYGALFAFQVLAAVSLQCRRNTLALLLGAAALALASLTFNSTAYQITFGEWAVLTVLGLFSPSTAFASVCELLPFVTCLAIMVSSIRRIAATNTVSPLSQRAP